MSILLKLLPILRTFTFYVISVTICCGAHRTKALSRSRKFRSSKMNLNAFLRRFPTVFDKYITILDKVRKIRRFHSIPFEFQGFENRPQICFLPCPFFYSALRASTAFGRPSGDVPCASEAMACGYRFSKWRTTKSIGRSE